MINKQKRIAAALSAAALTIYSLCGCSDSELPEENGIEEVTVISDGTQAETAYEMPPLSDYYADYDKYSDWETRFGYFQLTEEDRKIYDATVSTMKNMSPKLPLYTDERNYRRILNLISIEQLEIFYLKSTSASLDDRGKYFNVDFSYRYSATQVEEMTNLTELEAQNLLSSIPTGTDDYQKLLYIHDWLVKNVSKNTESEYAASIYGTLVKRTALCEGYAKTFSYLCNLLGIENIIVTGFTDVPHMWNMVRLDGSWYHVDVTWDDVNIGLPDFVSYQFFLVPDKTVKENRTIDSTIFIPPEAKGGEYEYFVKEGLMADTVDEFPEVLAKSIVRSARENSRFAMIKFSKNDEYIFFLNEINNSDKGIKSALETANARLAEDGISVEIETRINADPYRTAVFILKRTDS